MTTRLRELAESWKGGTASHDYEMGRQECADELLSILDAEGDGGAVDRHDSDCATHNMPAFPNGECDCSLRGTEPAAWISHRRVVGLPDKDFYGKLPIQSLQPGFYSHTPLYAHPARSGVVSDEDVRDAARYRWLREHTTDGFMGTGSGSLNCDEPASEWDAWIDARKGERHE